MSTVLYRSIFVQEHSCFDLVQQCYAEYSTPHSAGFSEVVEVRDPPTGRVPIVVGCYASSDHFSLWVVTSWVNLECALKAFDKTLGKLGRDERQLLTMFPGFVSKWSDSHLSPWYQQQGLF